VDINGVNGLYRVERKEQLADKIYQMWIRAPHVAHHAQAGQFVMIRLDEKGERIPLTISAIDGDSFRVIFMTIGKTTTHLAAFNAGDHVLDVVGPLGKPSDVKKYGTCALVGGGVGSANLPIIARAAKALGNRVIGIIGARNASMVIIEDEMKNACDEFHLATDDGSKGFHGFAADVLKQVMAQEKVDAVWIIGPAIMMKGVPRFRSRRTQTGHGTGKSRRGLDHWASDHDESDCRVHTGSRDQNICLPQPDYGRRDRYVRFLPCDCWWRDKICVC